MAQDAMTIRASSRRVTPALYSAYSDVPFRDPDIRFQPEDRSIQWRSVHDSPSKDSPPYGGIAQVNTIQNQLEMRDCSVSAFDLIQEREQ
jgi:hypothetical protein